MVKIHSSEITAESVYLSRRKFLRSSIAAGITALVSGSLNMSACSSEPTQTNPASATFTSAAPVIAPNVQASTPTGEPHAMHNTDELGDALTTYDDITHYNNYYEFSTVKQEVAQLAQNLKTSPWTVQIGGLVNHPKTYSVDDLRRLFGEDERVYRLRCIEGWSMVIPWLGFPVSSLLNDVGPMSRANFVQYTSLADPQQMPRQTDKVYPWPYTEGLKIDEAMNNLTLLATGMYGKAMPPQDGAPIRLVVPWKYGFKSAKAIVKIDLVEDMPSTFWVTANPTEYGFYANVNPTVPHPRWSQSTERRIGELNRIKTLMFNGYSDEVADLYKGMDLKANF